MNTTAIIALSSGVALAFIIRLANVLLLWLAKVLGVDPPSPIPEPEVVADAAARRQRRDSAARRHDDDQTS